MLRFADLRFDASSVVDLPDGSIRVSGRLTHTGVFNYRDQFGNPRREYRPASEVFSPSSLASFAGAPVTINHPPERKVTAETWKLRAVGHLGDDVRQDGSFMDASVYVRDAEAVRRVKSGDLKHISLGYRVAKYDPTPGETEKGERYDGIQREIVGNHCALLPAGTPPRGGEECQLRLDSDGDEVWSEGARLDWAVDEKQLAALNAQIEALKGELAKMRTDSAELETTKVALAKAQADIAAATVSPERLDSLVEERATLVSLAKTLKIETKGVSSLALKRAIVKARTPSLADRTDSMVEVALDAALAVYADSPHPSMKTVLGTVADASKPTLPSNGSEQRTDSGETPAFDPFEAGRKAASALHTMWTLPASAHQTNDPAPKGGALNIRNAGSDSK